jgi:hypothetical protein
MTITRAPATSASHSMQGDLVRIAAGAGASFNGLPGAASVFVTGAFGTIGPIGPDGSRVLNMHELMPAEIAVVQTINLAPGTLVERISVDNPNELAILGLQYLNGLKDFIRNRMNATDGVMRNILMVNLQSDANRIAAKLSESGISVVEKIDIKTITTKSVFLTSNPQAIQDGEMPANVIRFDFEAQSGVSSEMNVHPASRAMEVLFSPTRVSQGVAAPVAAVPAMGEVELTPFMRHMLGMPMNPAAEPTLSVNDLIGPDGGDGDGEGDGFTPQYRY